MVDEDSPTISALDSDGGDSSLTHMTALMISISQAEVITLYSR